MPPLAPTAGARPPGSFSASTNLTPAGRPAIRRILTDSSDENLMSPGGALEHVRAPAGSTGQAHVDRQRRPPVPLFVDTRRPQSPYQEQSRPRPSPLASQSQSQPESHTHPYANQNYSTSSSSLNYSRPSAPFARSETATHRSSSPLSARQSALDLRALNLSRTHTRKHSSSQAGYFEPSLPGSSFLPSSIGVLSVSDQHRGYSTGGSAARAPSPGNMTPNPLSASQIAAQAAMLHQSAHVRQRSQTLPDNTPGSNSTRRPSGQRGPNSPPMLSVTEASGERQSAFGREQAGMIGQREQQVYKNGLLGESRMAAATAANHVYTRSHSNSPGLSTAPFEPPPPGEPEKAVKPEKSSKVKLFSRPGRISTKDAKEKTTASPNKTAFPPETTNLQRGNASSAVLDHTLSTSASLYSMANSSSSTIRPPDTSVEKEKKEKHGFLSRQKHKLSAKDEHHLPLSSAASNSRPVDPSAPSSLYNFDLPSSPGIATTSFAKTMSGLDLRHGGRALRDKKKEEKAQAGSNPRDNETPHSHGIDWFPGIGPPSSGSGTAMSFLTPSVSHAPSIYNGDIYQDLSRYGLNNMTADDAWPFLKAKLLIVFEGEDLRYPVEEFNRLVLLHIQRCIQKRAPNLIVEDVREFLVTGFSSLDLTLRRTPDERIVPHLVEMWTFVFTSVLPYMQAVFLPLDLEFAGHGTLLTPAQAREFWGALPVVNTSSVGTKHSNQSTAVPATQLLEIRRIVLTTYRDVVILPRFETLKTIFSRLSLESINHNLNLSDLSSSSSSGTPFSHGRPGTAMSLDPSTASYNSQTTTLLGGGPDSSSNPSLSGVRSRAISNVSFGSDRARDIIEGRYDRDMPAPTRPFTPSSTHPSILNTTFATTNPSHASSREYMLHAHALQREANVAESKNVTEIVGRMLQCTSVLASVGTAGDGDAGRQAKMEELCKGLKLNWLGRGRTGRNRMGLVGARVRKAEGGTGTGTEIGMGASVMEESRL